MFEQDLHMRITVHYRYITAEGIELPAVPLDKRDEQWEDHDVNIDTDIPGWAYPEEELDLDLRS